VVQGGLDPLEPRRALLVEILIQPHPGPGLEHVRRRDPRLGQVVLAEQLPQVAGVGPVGLGAALGTSLGGRLRRLGQVGLDAGPLQLLHHVTPAGAALHGEGHLALALETAEEGPKVRTVGWDDTTPIDLAGDHIKVVVGELAPVQIEPSYDGHGTSSSSYNSSAPAGLPGSPATAAVLQVATAVPGRSPHSIL
jgi:hypothetical protein